MMKHIIFFKKVTIVTTAAFLLLLTATTETTPVLPNPSITIETDEDTNSEQPDIQPMADEQDEERNAKKNH